MGCYLQEPYQAPAQDAAKNRVMGSRRDIGIIVRKTAPQPVESHRANRPVATKPASGIPYWLSRDPIGEEGGLNLYGFVGNDGVNRWDYLGLDSDRNSDCTTDIKVGHGLEEFAKETYPLIDSGERHRFLKLRIA